MVRIAGTVCLLMLFAGLLFADDLMKLDDQGGVTRFKVDPNGNVGIGTTSPSNKLHVQGSDSAGRVAVIENASSSGSPEGLLVLTNQNSGSAAKFAVGSGTVGSHTKNFVVTNAGSVGIGTTTPPNKLSIRETTAGTNAVQIYNNSSNAIKIRIPANGLSENFSGEESVLYVGKDVASGRSINAAGSINQNGGDFAEWIAWEGEKPEPGTIITYKGTNVVVSSQKTAGFTAGDVYPTGTAILIAFVGQVPVKVKGEVHEGDYILPAGDGTGVAVSSKKISFDEYRQSVGIAWEESELKGVKMIKVAVGIK